MPLNQTATEVLYADPEGVVRDHLKVSTLAYFIGGPLDLVKRILDHRPNEFRVAVVPAFTVARPPCEFGQVLRPEIHKYVIFGRVPSGQHITSAHMYTYVGLDK